ncbi:hypothetical protein GH714_009566 [Hevea brasiliensis]|uniref:Pectate lyase domain-containing protein n=1 Tax=Hevea brasiliensis TaxID=3981 RepID=A0A6A6N3C0_HEVBR|nr:hypothetical protein GH714_009566 [Hevea brasiliensis]
MTSLPYADVDFSLRSIAGRAEGFGRFAIGGLHGPLYYVTHGRASGSCANLQCFYVGLLDDGPGSLREGCRRRQPLWIVLRFRGRGHDVDGIQIKPNSRHIWIDRCSLRDYDDGLIDITRQSTDITVSRCYFAQHDKTMLIGADPSHVGDRCIRVTIHHCFFDGTRQRQPRLRFGKVHLYNNYTRNWGIYAVCASVESQIFSQYNIYEAGQKKKTFEYYTEKAADKEEAKSGLIISEGDVFLNGAQSCLLTGVGEECVFHPSEYYPTWTLEAPSDSLKAVVQICAGVVRDSSMRHLVMHRLFNLGNKSSGKHLSESWFIISISSETVKKLPISLEVKAQAAGITQSQVLLKKVTGQDCRYVGTFSYVMLLEDREKCTFIFVYTRNPFMPFWHPFKLLDFEGPIWIHHRSAISIECRTNNLNSIDAICPSGGKQKQYLHPQRFKDTMLEKEESLLQSINPSLQ